jgi:glycosyltransferase involved in cell wall biosynthesis
MTDVSFVIPSFNSYLTIQKTLLSIFGQKSFDRVREVLVVDSSDDGKTRKILEGFHHPQLKIIKLDQKTSPAAGRNTGASMASGELLCFIDSDVYLSDDWLEHVLAARQANCRAGCGSVSIPDFQKKSSLALAQLYLQFNESLAVGERRPVKMVPACNMFVERSLFERAGRFPNLRASEDVVLCLKMGEFAQVWFVPEAKCFHVFRESVRSYLNNQLVLGRYIIIYRRRMYRDWYYRGLWPVALLPSFLLIKSIRIKIRLFKSGSEHFHKFIQSSPLFTLGLLYWAAGFFQGCFSRES